jgi:hypothetical protein
MTEQEKKEFQAIKERVIYLEGVLLGMQGKQGIPVVSTAVNPYAPLTWYGPYLKYEVTC